MAWQTWVIVLTWGISKGVVIYVLCEPLSLKYNKTKVVLLFAFMNMLFYLVRAYVFVHTSFFMMEFLYHLVILPLSCLIFFKIVFKEKLKKIILFEILIYALGILAQLLAYNIFIWIFNKNLTFDFVSNESMYAGLIALFTEVSLYLLFYCLWKRNFGKLRLDIPNTGAFLVLVGAQLIYTMNKLVAMLFQQEESRAWSIVGIFLLVLGNLAILQILLTNSKKKEIEDYLKDIQHIRELEKMHFTAIEARRDEMAKIRHDFNNQLLAAHHLIAVGKDRQAGKLLNELEEAIINTKETTFCQNAIVNAVLTEKQAECNNSAILLAADICVDNDCNISQLHLCSIFSNMIDNAISACKQVPRSQRKIEIRTAYKGDYLLIKCVNPVSLTCEKDHSRKGYGQIILADIAEQYNGNFTAEKNNNTYFAMLSLVYTSGAATLIGGEERLYTPSPCQ